MFFFFFKFTNYIELFYIVLYRLLKIRMVLTIPMASNANRTVPKNNVNSDKGAYGRLPSKVSGSRNI